MPGENITACEDGKGPNQGYREELIHANFILVTKENGATMEIRLQDYPQLRLLCWSIRQDATITEEEALAMYERNWYLVDKEKITEKEDALIKHLVKTVGNGIFHV